RRIEAVVEGGAAKARDRDLDPAGADRILGPLADPEHDDLRRAAFEALRWRLPAHQPSPPLPAQLREVGPEPRAPIGRREGVPGELVEFGPRILEVGDLLIDLVEPLDRFPVCELTASAAPHRLGSHIDVGPVPKFVVVATGAEILLGLPAG